MRTRSASLNVRSRVVLHSRHVTFTAIKPPRLSTSAHTSRKARSAPCSPCPTRDERPRASPGSGTSRRESGTTPQAASNGRAARRSASPCRGGRRAWGSIEVLGRTQPDAHRIPPFVLGQSLVQERGYL